MGMDYHNLDQDVRALMIEEVEFDGHNLYGSAYFNEAGAMAWKNLLLEACASGTDGSLAEAIRVQPYLRAQYARRSKNGTSMVNVPYNAHDTIAESNFSRFYLRGLCRHAMKIGVVHLIGYRAMAVEKPRPGSEEKIGANFHAAEMLDDLRATMAAAPLLGMPPGVGSGILARLP